MMWNLRSRGETLSKEKTEYLQHNQTSGGPGTDDKTKGKPGTGKSKGKQDAKARARTKESVNNKARKGRKEDVTAWRGTKTRKKNKPVKNTQSGRTRVGITLTTDAEWWSSDRSTDLWNDPAWEQGARQLPSTQPAQEQCNPTHGGSISMLGGLTMCELSVDDKGQQSEQNDGDRNRRDNWNNMAKNWDQNELTDGHKSWNNRICDRN